jgi:hypothetical protein
MTSVAERLRLVRFSSTLKAIRAIARENPFSPFKGQADPTTRRNGQQI